MIQKISILTADKQALQEKNALLQRQLGNLDLEKREAERSKLRLEKDKHVLRKTLDKVCCHFDQCVHRITTFLI